MFTGSMERIKNMTENNTELHWVRVRHKDSNEAFVDPMADIKVVVQQAFKEAPHFFAAQGNTEQAERLRQILKVFVTKLEEDATPVDQILKEFNKVLMTEMKEMAVDAIFAFAMYIISAFALHMRRDSAADKSDRNTFNSAAALLHLYSTEPLIKDLLQSSAKLKDVNDNVYNFKGSPVVNAVCFEQDSKTIKDIKDIVASSLGATGDQSWEAVAKACDKFVADSVGTDEQKLAAALAYPTYDMPCFEAGGAE
jgi:hypothetical protein